MTEYCLYLDESETHDDVKGLWTNKIFSIVGAIVKQDDHDKTLTEELNSLKENIWHDLNNPTSLILHEKDIRFAQQHNNRYHLDEVSAEYHRFRSRRYSRLLYDGLEKIIIGGSIQTIGAAIVIDKLSKYFNRDILTDQYLIATQMILENYCHFLQWNNGIGKVVYESRSNNQNRDVRMRFTQIKAMGTMYISPYAIQEKLISIDFYDKSKNITGLQIADFMANNVVRKISNKLYGKPLKKFALHKPIFSVRYDGGIGLPDRFGIKVLP